MVIDFSRRPFVNEAGLTYAIWGPLGDGRKHDADDDPRGNGPEA